MKKPQYKQIKYNLNLDSKNLSMSELYVPPASIIFINHLKNPLTINPLLNHHNNSSNPILTTPKNPIKPLTPLHLKISNPKSPTSKQNPSTILHP